MRKIALPHREDWVASLVVFIVAMPLSLGIALASGCPPAAGLITAVAGGIVAGALAGAPLSVTGPAAGLTAIVFQLAQQYGMAGLAVITVLCGVVQVVMGAIRAGKIFTLIPAPVLEGVLSAIGLIIVLGQLHVLTGAGIPNSPITAALTFPQSLGRAFSGGIAPVLICGLLALAVQMVWSKYIGKTKFKWLPGALPAVVFVTLVSLIWEMPRVELAPFLPTIQASISDFFSPGRFQGMSMLIVPALALAVVASAESLLTARAIDTMVATRAGFKPANLNRELLAQGAANVLSGIIGGIPMTAVMVRSAANVNSGGKTRWSTILHGVWIAVFVGVAPGVIGKIPLTALAAVLILVGVKLINLGHFLEVMKKHQRDGLAWLSTTVAVFSTDLLKGLIIGIVIYCAIYSDQLVKKLKRG